MLVTKPFSKPLQRTIQQLCFTKHNSVRFKSSSVLVFGANTDVGKSVFSAGLVQASLKRKSPTLYIKPLQTGALGPEDPASDEHAIRRRNQGSNSQLLTCDTLYCWPDPVSPHVAATIAPLPDGNPSDEQILGAVNARSTTYHETHQDGLVVIETAGGVLSPGSNGTTQGDMYKPLKVPVVLVGDARLGGISATLTSLESLDTRQYNVKVIVFVGEESSSAPDTDSRLAVPLGNKTYVQHWLSNHPNLSDASVFQLPTLPQDPTVPLDEWYRNRTTVCVLDQILRVLL